MKRAEGAKRTADPVETLRHAADLLEDEAGALFASHTLNGEWVLRCSLDRRAKALWRDMNDTASALRRMATGWPAATAEGNANTQSEAAR